MRIALAGLVVMMMTMSIEAQARDKIVTDDFLAKQPAEWNEFTVDERRRYIAAISDQFDMSDTEAGIFSLCMSSSSQSPQMLEFLLGDMIGACILYAARESANW